MNIDNEKKKMMESLLSLIAQEVASGSEVYDLADSSLNLMSEEYAYELRWLKRKKMGLRLVQDND